MIKGQKMEIALGKKIWIEGFRDNVPRLAKPFILDNLLVANMYLSSFDNEDLYANFQNPTATEAMAAFFGMVFEPQSDDEFQTLLHNIDKDNFAEIVCDIKRISGISDAKGEVDIDKTTSSMDWNVAVCCIPIYSSTSIKEVPQMTLIQFNETLKIIGKDINFKYKTSTISMVKEPSDYIKESEHPLYSQPEVVNKRLTLKDLAGFI